MKKYLKSYKFWLVILAVIAVLGSLYLYHMANRYKVLDRAVFNDFADRVASVSESGSFASQKQLSSFITDWADENALEYKVDSAGNIIFDTPAIERKKNVTPTVIIVGINYLTAHENAELLASAASIAATELNSGRKTVIFANNEMETNYGFKKLSDKYIGKKSKVIYLDYGPRAYASVNSYAESVSEIIIPSDTEKNDHDSAIKIHISGINTSAVGPEIADQPSPIYEMGVLLTRLKSRSVDFRIADFDVVSHENMYPVSMDITIALNSYALSSYTRYVDQRIRDFERKYSNNNPEFKYTYEIIENEEEIPATCYNAQTGDLVARLLYTINSGVYKFTENDPVPESRDIGDIYGINCMMDLEKGSKSIVLTLQSQAYDDTFLNRIVMDNHAAAELNECSFEETLHVDAFMNEESSLLRTLRNTYGKVYGSSDGSGLSIRFDERFTPCSYLLSKNTNADIVHLRLSSRSAAKLTNTMMCYIKSKGNTFTL